MLIASDVINETDNINTNNNTDASKHTNTNDVLELNTEKEDLYLSDIDDKPTVSSVVVCVQQTIDSVNSLHISEPTESTVDEHKRLKCVRTEDSVGTLTSEPTESAVCEHKRASCAQTKPSALLASDSAESSVSTRRTDERLTKAQPPLSYQDNLHLFPNPPKRRQPVFDDRFRIPREQSQQLVDVDIFTRRTKTHQKHSSDHRNSDKASRDSRIARAQPSKPTSNDRSSAELIKNRERLQIAIERVKRKPAPPQRTVQVIGPPFGRLGPPTSSVRTTTRTTQDCQANKSTNAFRQNTVQPIRKEVKDAAVQTEPCRCQRVLKAKNKKRREVNKINRDIVRRLHQTHIQN